MMRVVIGSPYAATENRTIDQNIGYARRALRHSLERGEAPFAPHLLYTQSGILDDSIESERLQGIQAGHEWLTTCDLAAFYIDHGWSKGMLLDLKVARLFGRNIELRSIGNVLHPIPPPEVQSVLRWEPQS